MAIRMIFISLLLMAVASGAHCQSPNYRHYGVNQGLPSSEVYHVFQDSKGFIWFATNMGVSRFDGEDFQNFDVEDGLPDNTVFEIYEDYRGRIWFMTMNLELAYYQQGKIQRYPYNEQLKQAIGNNRELYQKCGFHVDSADNVYISIRSRGLYQIDSTGLVEKLTNDEPNSLEAFYLEDELILSKSTDFKNLHDKLYVYRNDTTRIYLADIQPKKRYNRSFAAKNQNSEIYYLDNQLIQLEEDSIQHNLFQPGIIWMSKDSSSQLWLGTREGALRFGQFDVTARQTRFLSQYAVSSVLEDHEGGFWFSTLQHGVFYAPQKNILNYTKSEDLAYNDIGEVAIDSSNNVWIGYEKPILGRLYDDKFINYQTDKISKTSISGLEYDHYLQRLWIGRAGYLYYFNCNNNRNEFNILSDKHFLKAVFIEGSERWMGTSTCLQYFRDTNLIFNSSFDHNFKHQVEALYKEGDILYLGTLSGLWRYLDGEYFHLGRHNDLLYHRITAIEKWRDHLLLGTRGAGLLIKKEDSVFQITEKDGLISNSIKTMGVYKDHIWLATSRGLSRVQVNNLSERNYRIFNLGSYNGLPSSEVNDLAIRDSIQFVATAKGLTRFNMNRIGPNTNPPQLYLKNIMINARDTTLRQHYQLEHDQNFFTIDYKGLSYRMTDHLPYKYRMLGLDSTWKKTNRSVKSFTTLPPGQYVFQVKASNEDGVWSRQPFSIAFDIAKPFWETWWFIGLIVLISGTGVWAIFHFRLQMVRRRRELLQSINEYKQKMLRQQMNPHFIFNTLNSIQYFLLDEDTTSSLTYLSKFAKLMRIVLDNSQHTFIPIEDEIRGLRLYLELESLRFEDSFDYEIHIDQDVNAFEYKIPALLIQPYVENSIRHGLLHKKGHGYLQVRLTHQEDYLFCLIEDNGIGRKKAEEIKQKQGAFQQSLGSKITEDRIDILNTLYSEEIDISYVDLEDDQGNPRGTRVEIRLPYIY